MTDVNSLLDNWSMLGKPRNTNGARLVCELKADHLAVAAVILKLPKVALVRTTSSNGPTVLVRVDALDGAVNTRRVGTDLGHDTGAARASVGVSIPSGSMPAAITTRAKPRAAPHWFRLPRRWLDIDHSVRSCVLIGMTTGCLLWRRSAVHSSVNPDRVSNLGLRGGNDVKVENNEDALVDEVVADEVIEADETEEGDFAFIDEAVELGGQHGLLEVDAIRDGQTVARWGAGVAARLGDALELADLHYGMRGDVCSDVDVLDGIARELRFGTHCGEVA